MLIHCDPLRPSRETCHELPVRIMVSSFYHLQRPSTQPTPHPTSPLSFSKKSRLCSTNQVDIKEAQVPPHNLVGRNQPWVSGSTFGGSWPSLLLWVGTCCTQWHTGTRGGSRTARGGQRQSSGLACAAAGKGLRGTVVILSVLPARNLSSNPQDPLQGHS